MALAPKNGDIKTIVQCNKCGSAMHQTKGEVCYKDALWIRCDKCRKYLSIKDNIYHCYQDFFHSNGYDYCLQCVTYTKITKTTTYQIRGSQYCEDHQFMEPNICCGAANFNYDSWNKKIIIKAYNNSNDCPACKEKGINDNNKCSKKHVPDIEIKSYHVSCRSDYIDNKDLTINYAGIVLYSFDNKTDWYENGVHCKSGYIFITESSSLLKKYPTEPGAVHGACYRHLFGKSLTNYDTNIKIICGGFARKDGEWKFNSATFNASQSDGFHDGSSAMNKEESKWLKKAIDNWSKNNQQNTYID